jgi:hypothetical protein
MADLLEMAKAVGLAENDIKGKSDMEAMALIAQAFEKAKLKIEAEADNKYIDNLNGQLPKLQNLLAEPFDIYVKKVGQKRSATPVRVVGFNSETQEIIVCHNKKVYSIEAGDQIKSADELAEARSVKKPKKQTKKT